MTPRRSARAKAREIYREALEQDALSAPSLTLPRKRGREESEQGEGEQSESSLTERVRRLYEQSAVPVREIAAVAGVTERTIYKYAQKHGWAPRYAWPGGGRPVARWPRWHAQAALAPAKGAGGRFVAREDKDRPHATGLKATDPQGAARAAAACGRAQQIADDAWRAAERERRLNEHADALDGLRKAVQMLGGFREERARRKPLPDDAEFEQALLGVVNAWIGTLRQLQEADAADPG